MYKDTTCIKNRFSQVFKCIIHCVQFIYSALLPFIAIAQQIFRKEKKQPSATKKQTWRTVPYLEGTTSGSSLQLFAGETGGESGRRWQSHGKARQTVCIAQFGRGGPGRCGSLNVSLEKEYFFLKIAVLRQWSYCSVIVRETRFKLLTSLQFYFLRVENTAVFTQEMIHSIPRSLLF